MVRARAIGPYLVSAALIGAFWVTAALSDFFLDRPFIYTTPDEWSSHFLRSSARFPNHAEIGLHMVAGAFVLPAILCIAARLSVSSGDPLSMAWARVGTSSRQVAVGMALLAVLLAGVVSFSVIDGVSLIDDERSYLFQASLFARGLVKLPPAPAGLRAPMILVSPAWMSKYPPGQSAALVPGVLLGVPRVVPPLLIGLLVYFLYEFVREMYGERQGLLAAALLVGSPFAWCVGATLMPFSTFACALMGALWLFVRSRKRNEIGSAVGSGLALGFASLVRPFDAAAFALPLGVLLVRDLLRPPAVRSWRIVWLATGVLPFVAVLLAYNWATAGSPFRFAYGLAKEVSFGFFTQSLPGFAYEHTPLQAVAQTATAIGRLDMWLFGWPTSLLLVLVGAWAVAASSDRFVLWLIGSFMAAFSLVASTGTWDVGPTYYFAVAPLAVVLAVRGIRALRERMSSFGDGVRFFAWLPLVGAMVALVTIVPVRFIRLGVLSAEIDAPWRAIAESKLGESIVVLPGAAQMAAAGYLLGYPYEIQSGTGTAHLVRPHSAPELEDARRFLGMDLPVVQLILDEEAFRRSGVRRYQFKPLS